MPVAMKLSMIVETTSLTPAGHLQHAGDRGVGGPDEHGDEDDEGHVESAPAG